MDSEQLRLELARVTAQLTESNTRLKTSNSLARRLQLLLDGRHDKSSKTADTSVIGPTDTTDEKDTSTTGQDLPSSASENKPAIPANDGSAAAHLPNTGTKPTPLLRSFRADKTAPGSESDRARLHPLSMDTESPAKGDHTPNAPLLFPEQTHASRRRKTKPPKAGKHFIRDSRRSSFAVPLDETLMKTRYPMFVLPVKILLRLERLLPHQEMLEQGLLLPYNEFTMKGRIMFISHQCAYGISSGHSAPLLAP